MLTSLLFYEVCVSLITLQPRIPMSLVRADYGNQSMEDSRLVAYDYVHELSLEDF